MPRTSLFSLIAAGAMWSLAKRFSEWPLGATLLFLAVPAFRHQRQFARGRPAVPRILDEPDSRCLWPDGCRWPHWLWRWPR